MKSDALTRARSCIRVQVRPVTGPTDDKLSKSAAHRRTWPILRLGLYALPEYCPHGVLNEHAGDLRARLAVGHRHDRDVTVCQ